jgi:NADPH:quinone reductase-like Zn-dependent oxidoreductase
LRAAVFREFGGPEVLQLERLPDPEWGEDDVVVRVAACGVNHCDLDSRAGTSRWSFDLPMVLGGEIAGEVVQAGRRVEGLAAGDNVAVLQHYWRDGHAVQLGIDCWGGYAGLVRVPGEAVVPLDSPDDCLTAAAAQTAVSTAWRMVFTLAEVRPDETVLIPSASGGVGSALVQCAALAGARVIATVGSPEKVAPVRALGADTVVCHADASVGGAVAELTGGAGVDAVLDTVGGAAFEEHLSALRDGGRLVTCGAHAGEVVALDVVRLFQRGHRLIGFGFATTEELRTALTLATEGRVHVPVAGTYPLAEAGAAHAALDARRHVGKLLLLPESEAA